MLKRRITKNLNSKKKNRKRVRILSRKATQMMKTTCGNMTQIMMRKASMYGVMKAKTGTGTIKRIKKHMKGETQYILVCLIHLWI